MNSFNIASSNSVINSLSVNKIVTINDIQGLSPFPLPPLICTKTNCKSNSNAEAEAAAEVEDMFLRTFQNGGPSYNYSNNKGRLTTTNFNSIAGMGTKNSIAAGISNKIVINKPPPNNVLGKSLTIGVLKCTENNNKLTCEVEKTFQINNDVNVTFAQFGDTYIPPA
jgi:hypothetical protein